MKNVKHNSNVRHAISESLTKKEQKKLWNHIENRMNKKSKRIELTENTIKYLAKKAIDEGTSFKPYVESILESLANTQVGATKNN